MMELLVKELNIEVEPYKLFARNIIDSDIFQIRFDKQGIFTPNETTQLHLWKGKCVRICGGILKEIMDSFCERMKYFITKFASCIPTKKQVRILDSFECWVVIVPIFFSIGERRRWRWEILNNLKIGEATGTFQVIKVHRIVLLDHWNLSQEIYRVQKIESHRMPAQESRDSKRL